MRWQQLGRERSAVDFPNIQRVLVLVQLGQGVGGGLDIRPICTAQGLHFVGGRCFHLTAVHAGILGVQVL